MVANGVFFGTLHSLPRLIFYFHFQFFKHHIDSASSSLCFCVCKSMAELNQAFFQDLSRKFFEKTTKMGNDQGCILWVGYVDKYGYGVQNVSWPLPIGRKKEAAHRVAYMIRHLCSRNDMPRVNPNKEVIECSHLCQNKLCVNAEHIVLETHSINQDRIHCKNQGFCSKGHEPHCLICNLFIFAKSMYFFHFGVAVVLFFGGERVVCGL